MSVLQVPDIHDFRNLPAPRLLSLAHYVAASHALVCGDGSDTEEQIVSLAHAVADVLQSLLPGIRTGALLPYVDAWLLLSRIGFGKSHLPEVEIDALLRIVRAPVGEVSPAARATALARLSTVRPGLLSTTETRNLTWLIDRFTAESSTAVLTDEESQHRIIFLASLQPPLATHTSRTAVRDALDRIMRMPLDSLPTAKLALIHTLFSFVGQPDIYLLRLLTDRPHSDPLTQKAYALELRLLTD